MPDGLTFGYDEPDPHGSPPPPDAPPPELFAANGGREAVKVYREWPTSPEWVVGWYKDFAGNDLDRIEELVSGEFGAGRYIIEHWKGGSCIGRGTRKISGGPPKDKTGEPILMVSSPTHVEAEQGGRYLSPRGAPSWGSAAPQEDYYAGAAYSEAGQRTQTELDRTRREVSEIQERLKGKELEVERGRSDLERAKDRAEQAATIESMRLAQVQEKNTELKAEVERLRRDLRESQDKLSSASRSDSNSDLTKTLLTAALSNKGGGGGASEAMKTMREMFTFQAEMLQDARDNADEDDSGFAGTLKAVTAGAKAIREVMPAMQSLSPQQLQPGASPVTHPNPNPQLPPPAAGGHYASKVFVERLQSGLSMDPRPDPVEWAKGAVPFVTAEGKAGLQHVVSGETLDAWASRVESMDMNPLREFLSGAPDAVEWLQSAVMALRIEAQGG